MARWLIIMFLGGVVLILVPVQAPHGHFLLIDTIVPDPILLVLQPLLQTNSENSSSVVAVPLFHLI